METAPSTNSMVWIICREGGGARRGREGAAGAGVQLGGGLASEELHKRSRLEESTAPLSLRLAGTQGIYARRGGTGSHCTALQNPLPPHLVHHDLAKLKLLAMAVSAASVRACRTGRRSAPELVLHPHLVYACNASHPWPVSARLHTARARKHPAQHSECSTPLHATACCTQESNSQQPAQLNTATQPYTAQLSGPSGPARRLPPPEVSAGAREWPGESSVWRSSSVKRA